MTRVAIVTDAASDIPSDVAEAAGVTVVPLLVSFAGREYRTGIDMSREQFYERLTAPGAPFPTTAAAGPGTFQAVFEELYAGGAEAVVAISVGAKLSATIASCRIARDALRGRECIVVDSGSASMGLGVLVLMAAEMARTGAPAREIAAEVERRKADSRVFVVLETLEYLRRGGRISGSQAAIGGMLSIKPIITIEDGAVETVDRPRTRGRARERLLELLTALRAERVAVIHSGAQDIDAFADELARRIGIPTSLVTTTLMGPAVGAHVGPGAYGAVVLRSPG